LPHKTIIPAGQSQADQKKIWGERGAGENTVTKCEKCVAKNAGLEKKSLWGPRFDGKKHWNSGNKGKGGKVVRVKTDTIISSF